MIASMENTPIPPDSALYRALHRELMRYIRCGGETPVRPEHDVLGLKSVCVMWGPEHPGETPADNPYQDKVAVFFDLKDGRSGCFDYEIRCVRGVEMPRWDDVDDDGVI